MAQVVIENPILNSPFAAPDRHFRFDDDGIIDQIAESRRSSTYFVLVAQPRMQGKQLNVDSQWTADRVHSNKLVNPDPPARGKDGRPPPLRR